MLYLIGIVGTLHKLGKLFLNALQLFMYYYSYASYITATKQYSWPFWLV